jgi:hypothetical protein
MMRRKLVLAPLLTLLLTASAANAGPCNVPEKDAGAGPTPGYSGQTTGAAGSTGQQHPPTQSMNSAVKDQAASSQDAQRQQQGQPTAADQAMGNKQRENGC